MSNVIQEQTLEMTSGFDEYIKAFTYWSGNQTSEKHLYMVDAKTGVTYDLLVSKVTILPPEDKDE